MKLVTDDKFGQSEGPEDNAPKRQFTWLDDAMSKIGYM